MIDHPRFIGRCEAELVILTLKDVDFQGEWWREPLDWLAAHSERTVALDLSHVTRSSRELINGMLAIRRGVLARNGNLSLAHVGPRVRRSLANLHLAGTVFQLGETTA